MSQKMPATLSSRKRSVLLGRVECELQFLEQVYSGRFLNLYKEIMYCPEISEEGGYRVVASLRGHADSGWNNRISNVASPFIFLACFKILDMYVEDVLPMKLNKKGVVARLTFEDKVKELNSTKLDTWIESRPWLRDRVKALYKEMARYRNAFIHHWGYEAQADGALLAVRQRDPNRPRERLRKKILPGELESFARVVACLVEVKIGGIELNSLLEVNLRKDLNRLSRLHGKGKLDSMEFALVTFSSAKDHPTRDAIDSIHTQLESILQVKIVWFDLVYRVCVGADVIRVYHFDWGSISSGKAFADSIDRFQVSH